MISGVASIPRVVALAILAFYRVVLSPIFHSGYRLACRFEPSCSQYATDAMREYGLFRGGAFAIARFVRCNPWGGHGFDPIPARQKPLHHLRQHEHSAAANQSR